MDRRIALPGFALLLFLGAAFAGRMILRTHQRSGPQFPEAAKSEPAAPTEETPPATGPFGSDTTDGSRPVQLVSATSSDDVPAIPDEQVRQIILRYFPDLPSETLAGWIDTYSDVPRLQLERLLSERAALTELMPGSSLFLQLPEAFTPDEGQTGEPDNPVTLAIDAVQHNLRHVTTVGYRRTNVLTLPTNVSTNGRLTSLATELVFSFVPGEITPVSSPLHLAIDDDGSHWFELQPDALLTRCGAFVRLPDGTLGLQDGLAMYPVAGPINIPESTVRLSVAAQGLVICEAAGGETIEAGTLRLVRVVDFGALTSSNGVFFRAHDGRAASPSADVRIRVGALESSNVNLQTEKRLLDSLQALVE